MGVLEYTGEQQVYVPTPRGSEVPFSAAGAFSMPNILGERPDVPPADYGMDYLRREVGVANGWFVFGAPPELTTFVYQVGEELVSHANLSSFLMFDFWRNTYPYAPGEALATANDVMEVARGGLGTRRTIFELPFATWDKEREWVNAYVTELHKLFMADHSDSVLRNDRRDQGADPNNPHYTEVRVGLLGASTVLLITRSRIVRDEQGREILARLVELVKPTREMVPDILSELSLTERLRLEELLLRERATSAEREYVISKADRRTMQRDHHSVRDLIQEFHAEPKRPVWRKVGQGLLGLIDRIANTRTVKLIDEELEWWREQRRS